MFVILLFVLWPIAELAAAIGIAHLIGVVPMLLALLAGIPVGWWIAKAHGRGAMRRLAAAIAEGRTPSRELLDGGLGVFGGVLVIVPGFLTDLVGLLFVLPPSRAIARRLLATRLRTRFVMRAVDFTAARRPGDVDSTAHDVPPPQLTG